LQTISFILCVSLKNGADVENDMKLYNSMLYVVADWDKKKSPPHREKDDKLVCPSLLEQAGLSFFLHRMPSADCGDYRSEATTNPPLTAKSSTFAAKIYPRSFVIE